MTADKQPTRIHASKRKSHTPVKSTRKKWQDRDDQEKWSEPRKSPSNRTSKLNPDRQSGRRDDHALQANDLPRHSRKADTNPSETNHKQFTSERPSDSKVKQDDNRRDRSRYSSDESQSSPKKRSNPRDRFAPDARNYTSERKPLERLDRSRSHKDPEAWTPRTSSPNQKMDDSKPSRTKFGSSERQRSFGSDKSDKTSTKNFKNSPSKIESDRDRGDHRFGNAHFSKGENRSSREKPGLRDRSEGRFKEAPRRKPFSAPNTNTSEVSSTQGRYRGARDERPESPLFKKPRETKNGITQKTTRERSFNDRNSTARSSNARSSNVRILNERSSFERSPKERMLREKSSEEKITKESKTPNVSLKNTKNYRDTGSPAKVETPSPLNDSKPNHIYRGKAPVLNAVATCLIKNDCKSCSLVNLPYEESLEAKYQKGLSTLGALTDKAIINSVVPSPKPLGYRSHVKLAVRRNSDGLVDIGLYEPGSHQVVNLERCPVQTGNINHFIRKFREVITEFKMEPYDEATHSGWLRYIVVRSSHFSGELMITLVVTRHDEPLARKTHQFLRKNEEKFSALFFNINPTPGNVIFGPETIHIGGADTLSESLCNLKFEISPLSFFQVNPWQAENLYRTVEKYAGTPTNRPVAWDLYSGCGQITLLLSRLGYRALGIEEIPDAVKDAEANAKRNKLEAEFVVGRVEDSQWNLPKWSEKPSLIVANPSRRGMAESTRKTLSGVAIENKATVIYVSCDVDTLTRDLHDLVQGGLKLKQVHGFDMFAQTDNLEWLVVLTP